jgi:hypothetical protein
MIFVVVELRIIIENCLYPISISYFALLLTESSLAKEMKPLLFACTTNYGRGDLLVYRGLKVEATSCVCVSKRTHQNAGDEMASA